MLIVCHKKSIESNSYVFNHLKTLVSYLNGYYISCDIRAGLGFVTGCRIGFCDWLWKSSLFFSAILAFLTKLSSDILPLPTKSTNVKYCAVECMTSTIVQPR
jgi:hypothetical protein